LSTIEKKPILKVIEKHNGNISKAAKELGLTRTAFTGAEIKRLLMPMLIKRLPGEDTIRVL